MPETPSEKVQAKAAEYLLSGRVKVKELTEQGRDGIGAYFFAHVAPKQGGDPYFVRFNMNGWHCDCPARVQVCAHVLACQTITDFENRPVEKKSLGFSKDPSLDELLGGL